MKNETELCEKIVWWEAQLCKYEGTDNEDLCTEVLNNLKDCLFMIQNIPQKIFKDLYIFLDSIKYNFRIKHFNIISKEINDLAKKHGIDTK